MKIAEVREHAGISSDTRLPKVFATLHGTPWHRPPGQVCARGKCAPAWRARRTICLANRGETHAELVCARRMGVWLDIFDLWARSKCRRVAKRRLWLRR